MNAPLTGQDAAHLVQHASANADGSVEGVARHVTLQGCQFMLVSGLPQVGQKLTLHVSPDMTVTGTIRWILEDRAAFAFDRPIGAETRAELASHFAQLKASQLLPVLSAPSPR